MGVCERKRERERERERGGGGRGGGGGREREREREMKEMKEVYMCTYKLSLNCRRKTCFLCRGHMDLMALTSLPSM